MSNIVLSVIKPEKYFEGVMKLLGKEKSKNIIYVTTNKPYSFLVNSFKKKRINPDKIFFIDCISKQVNKNIEKAENCVFIGSPQNLTSLSIAVNEAISNIKGKKILFLDSLSVLLVYNDANTIGKFSNFLLNKMRASDVDTLMLALESDMDKDVIKQIESFSDETKKIN